MFVKYIHSPQKMNIVSQKREQVLRENNTAQETFEELLDKFAFDVKEIGISVPLHGDLDLEVLETRGYTSLESLIFGDIQGEITSLTHIPHTLKKLKCVRQLLVGVKIWLPLAEEIHLAHNHLTEIDLKAAPKLKRVHLQNNKLVEIRNLPISIEELYLDNNKIKTLDLKGLTNLRTLHCVNNAGIILSNVPRTLVDLKLDENLSTDLAFDEPSAESESPYSASAEEATPNERRNYRECLLEYFKLKSKYETKLHELREKAFSKGKTLKQKTQLAKEVVPECIKCKRRVGTVFEQNDTHYIALCGSKDKPCELKIDLYRGNYDNLDFLLDLYGEMVENVKTEINQQKLDVLFNYISEERSLKLFSQKLEDYNFDSGFYKTLLEKYNELHSSKYKAELSKQKITNIYRLKYKMQSMLKEYELTQTRVIIQDIMNIYVKEYLPEIHNLRQINYEVMEMYELLPDSNVFCLNQRDAKLATMDHLIGEPPSVKTFRV